MNNTSELFINNNVIAKVHSSKFLGKITDETLKCQEQIDAVANKGRQSLGVMYQIKIALLMSILYILYSTLILPYYQYKILYGLVIIPLI